MKKILFVIVLIMFSSWLFCQTRVNLGLLASIPINDSNTIFDPGIGSDLSLNYYLNKYVSINGSIEYLSNKVNNIDDKIRITSFYTGLGLNYNITQKFQIRFNPNIGTSIIKINDNTYNKMRIGSDFSIGYSLTKNIEIEPIIGVCYFVYDKPFDNDFLDTVKTGLRIGYNFWGCTR